MIDCEEWRWEWREGEAGGRKKGAVILYVALVGKTLRLIINWPEEFFSPNSSLSFMIE
jgi:hypothetical protein